MLFEQIFNKTFILFERFFKHEQLCYLNEFSKHEQMCYLNEFSIKHLSYLNEFSNIDIFMLLNFLEYLCYLKQRNLLNFSTT